MKYSRGYHSSAILLADGSILMGGDQDITNGWKSGENTPNERYLASMAPTQGEIGIDP